MNAKVYVLALSAFVVGMVELVIGGILPVIANDLQVTVSAAGQLITVFAFVLAVAGPVMLVLTAKMERKRLYLWTLLFFFIGNILQFVSPNYGMLMFARIFTAASTALILVLSLTITAKIVKEEYRARALGVIYMGLSSALVLGVPIGVLLTDAFGWRAPFLLIAFLTMIVMGVTYRFLMPISPGAVVPLREQLASLKSQKIVSAHLVTALFLAGHYTLYAYFTPFLQATLNLNPFWISAVYFAFGVAAVSGGAVGGWLADRWGVKKGILTVVSTFAFMLFLLPFTTMVPFIFSIALIIWGMASWAISPPQQSYLIQTAPETADIQQSLNQSALQFGIAAGSAAGGIVVSVYPVTYNAWVGAFIVLCALVSAIFSLTRKVPVQETGRR